MKHTSGKLPHSSGKTNGVEESKCHLLGDPVGVLCRVHCCADVLCQELGQENGQLVTLPADLEDPNSR